VRLRFSRLTKVRPAVAVGVAATAGLVGMQLTIATVASAADPLVSQGRPVLASSESSATYPAKNAVDGDPATRWNSVSHVDPQWIRVDLGKRLNISKVSLMWHTSCAKAYQIQVSDDGTSFTKVFSTTTGDGGTDDIVVKATGRYVRMFGTVRCRDAGYSLAEFKVYGAPQASPSPSRSPSPSPTPTTAPDPLVSQGKPAKASSDAGAAAVAANAVDGNTTTSWTSASGVDPQWLRIDLGVVYHVSRVTLLWDAACGKAYQIQVSDDNSTYTNVFLTTNSDGGTDDLPLQANGRYVRMFGTARCGTTAYSLKEFKVYGTPAPTRTWLSKGKPVTAANEDPVAVAANAVDGKLDTAWTSAPTTPLDPQWIRVDLGTPYQLSKVTLVWNGALCSQTYRIQVSDDDVDYSDEFTTAAGKGGTGGTENIYLNAVGRYVRLWNTLSCGTNTNVSLFEFKVYGTPPTPVPATGTITVGNQNGSFLADPYTGFSFGIEQLRRDINQGNVFQYLKTLGPGVMRWGGSTDENLWWTSTGEPMPTWAEFTLTPAHLQKLNALAVKTGWKVILGLNLKRDEDARAVDEAKFAKQILGDRLLALEMGNEPNYWLDYSPAQYYADWERLRAAIAAAVPGVPLLGPSVGRVGAGDVYLNQFADAQQAHPDLAVLASHFYPSCSRSASNGKINIPNLLSVDWHNRERLRADLVAGLAARLHVPGMITETNSVSCAGLAGVSDTFAAALWGVDELMSVAEAGDQALLLHGDLGQCDSPFYAPLCALTAQDEAAGRMRARPVYYAPLLVQQVGTGFIQPVSNDATSVVRAYAVRNGTRLRLVLVNVSDPATSTPYPVKIGLGASYTHGDYFRLSGPALDATTGVTLGGKVVAADGTFPGVTRTALTVNGRTLSIKLPAGSATVITLTP